jgi:protein-S-isoprenylcysteine O-methyltransferase Ste14
MWFKLAFGISFLLAMTVAARGARRAARQHGGALNQLPHEVRGLLAVRAMLGSIFYATLIAWMFWPRALTWMYLPVPATLRWTAVGLLVPTLAVFAASFRALGANYRGGVGLYPDHVLVTAGPYRHIRHPIYLAFIVIMCLVLLLSANWLLGLSGLLLVVSIAVARIPIEDRQLRERFGHAWVTYQAQTGGILPRVWRRPPSTAG